MTKLYESDKFFTELSFITLERFEDIIGYKLPEDYRSYLIEFNGSKPLNTMFHISEKEGDTNLHTMFGLHDGPEFAKLGPFFGDNNSTVETGLLAFADDTFGNYFCIQLLPKYYGEIYFYDHEVSNARKMKTLTKIANNFDEFIRALMSQSDYDKNLAETDPEFYERLQYAKKNPLV